MSIVPVYRLHATPREPYPRYRFARDAHPNPNPTPGNPNPDPESRWTVDRVAFFAWSDPEQEAVRNDALAPVYEFYRVDEQGLVRYRYAADPVPPRGWVGRRYVAFWLYPGTADGAGAPVYLYSQAASDSGNYALAVAPELPDWTNESILGAAADTVPVVVSVREGAEEPGSYRGSADQAGKHRARTREAGDYWVGSDKPGEYREHTGQSGSQREGVDQPGDYREGVDQPGEYREGIKRPDDERERIGQPGDERERVQELGDYHWTYTPSTINLSYPCTLQFVQAANSAWRFTNFEILEGREDFDRPTVTDRLVLVKARYVTPGRDFKYRLTIDVFEGPDRLPGDPEVVNQTPERL